MTFLERFKKNILKRQSKLGHKQNHYQIKGKKFKYNINQFDYLLKKIVCHLTARLRCLHCT